MEKLVINVPDQKIELVKQLLKELGVTVTSANPSKKANKTPNKLTRETIEKAKQGLELGEPISNIRDFVNSL